MAKTLELYFYRDGDETRVTNKQPVLEGGSVGEVTGSVGTEICDDGLKVFGIPRPGEFQIAKLRLTVEMVEIGEYELTATFKEFKPAKRRPRR